MNSANQSFSLLSVRLIAINFLQSIRRYEQDLLYLQSTRFLFPELTLVSNHHTDTLTSVEVSSKLVLFFPTFVFLTS